MPAINEMLKSNVDMSAYQEVEHSSPIITSAPYSTPESILRDPHLRSPVPPIGTISPDSLRQFYLGGRIPQTRVFIG